MNHKQERDPKGWGEGIADRAAPAMRAAPPAEVADQFAAALSHHQAGRFAEAERLYRQICAVDPYHADSLHLLGVLAGQVGRNSVAIDLIGRALAVRPDYAEAHYNLGQILAKEMKLDQAAAHYKSAAALLPESPEIHNSLGTLLSDQGKSTEAIACFERAVALKPDFVEALYSQGIALRKDNRLEEAVDRYERALAIKPDFVAGWLERGSAFYQLRRYEDSVTAYARALSLRPGSAEIWLVQGDAFCQLKRYEESLTAYDRALALRPDFAEAWLACGNIFSLLKRYDEAFAACDKALALKPDFAEAWFGRGSIFGRLKRYGDALTAYDKALTINPEHARAWFGRGEALRGLNRLEEAIAAYRQALAKGGDAQLIQYTLASLGAEAAPVAASKEYVTELFDRYADHFDEHLVGTLKYRIPELLLDAIKRLAPSGNLDILDMGCGTGLVGSPLRPLARTLTGVDISSNMIEIARQRQIYDNLVCSELIAFLQTQTKAFDLAVACDVFVYIGDLSGVFHSVRSALREGALFGFSVEASEDQDFVLRATRRYAHSRAYLRKLARDHGFIFETLESHVIRQQNGIDVTGNLAILRCW